MARARLASGVGSKETALTLVPVWDAERRELRLNTLVVKRFTRPSPNQRTILACFQEDDWPYRIDNPLAGASHHEAHEKLRDAVKKLNHNHGFLRFHLDGTGEGVYWELALAGRARTRRSHPHRTQRGA